MHDYTENALVEATAEQVFADLGWEVVNGWKETLGPSGSLGREHKGEVVLLPRLRAALERLNPSAPAEAIEQAIEELSRDRGALSLVNANREVWELLRDGVRVQVRDRRGEQRDLVVRVIDWQDPANNDYCYVGQFQVSGDIYPRRPDGVGFVNGLPLVLAEYKAIDVPVRNAYDDNLRDYKDTIPHLFPFNALIILSNGHRSRVGSLTASWEHFAEWKRIEREDEPANVSIETLIRGTCDPTRLLDLVENFTLFSTIGSKPVKLLAKNHQYLGVNNAVAALQRLGENRGRLGVFWHTQGSGKSFSMVFFSQKVLRRLPGNWTFLIVTDRDELDKQIYQNFADAGAVTEPEQDVHATSGEHLKTLLRENHRNLFTLIQKFHSAQGVPYPVLSERDDIIVMTDEAHRSQYDIFAMNMRRALPNAAFIGFTGTPLIAGEEKTREVFGDYVSIYNFRDSVEDHATVPLYYENRIPELQITNEQLDEDMQRLIDEAGLDEDQLEKLEREFRREYHLITRDERLETIAADIVAHYTGRLAGGDPGKAMVVSIDKATTVRMYDKVRKHWTAKLVELREEARLATPERREDLTRMIKFMETTDMAVVVSPSQNEVQDFRDKGLDILPHRRRMIQEPLADKFKEADDPFRIVFVCAMWITGFDVQSLSTIYLDKPMRNHTLMQTIARANRVYPGKLNGLIVDYIGVFRNLQQALAIYGSGSGGDVDEGDTPVRDKTELVERLRAEIADTLSFCAELGFDPNAIVAASGADRLRLMASAVEAILVNDETRREYIGRSRRLSLLYRAILPDTAAEEFMPLQVALAKIAGMIQSEIAPPDISEVMQGVADLLDASIATEQYVINENASGYGTNLVNLSTIDFDALRRLFDTGRRNTATATLRSAIERRLEAMVQRNRTRTDYLAQFQQMVDEYNSGSQNVQLFFERLLEFTQRLDEEEQRHIAQGLDEEAGAIFDLLTRPNPGLSKKEEEQVRAIARELLETLKQEKLVLDWRKRQHSRAAVRVTIEQVLDTGLPSIYSADDYRQRCADIYQHVYDAYIGPSQNIYSTAA